MRRPTLHRCLPFTKSAGRGRPWAGSKSWAGGLAGGLLLALLAEPLAGGGVLRVNGSTTVAPVVVDAAAILRRERGLSLQIDTLGGSSGGISALGDGRVDVALSSRPLNDEDRTRYPGVDFHGVAIGHDAVALVVSRDVWEGGVHSLSRGEIQGIYEGRVRNWREVGGPDRRIVFFNKEPGRGTWEVFAAWLYGDPHRAPLVAHPEVGANEEARTKVASTRGAISALSAAWADGKTVFALALEMADGSLVRPTPEEVEAGVYPITRPLLLLTRGGPRGETGVLIHFLLSSRGQALVARHGYLPLATSPGERASP